MNANARNESLAHLITGALHEHGMSESRRVIYERGSTTNGLAYKFLYTETDGRGHELQGRVIVHGRTAREVMLAAQGFIEGIDEIDGLTH